MKRRAILRDGGYAFAAAVCLWSLSAAAFAEPSPEAPAGKNRLADETSPYLLLHAHNPVDWHPWGQEALDKAKAENKLIFLSIGYSSCYWCHVMERESFMDDQIARYINEHFVPIKVDREERPDVDEIYMTSLQVMGRRGGWPLTVFLTPDAKPFFGGTYFPPRDKEVEVPGSAGERGERQRMTGLLTVLKLVQDGWQESPDELGEAADQVSTAVKRALAHQALLPAQPLSERLADEAAVALWAQYDHEHGGFGYSAANPQQPKFPEPPNLLLLVHLADRGNQQARQMLLGTLEHMAAGGIRDHVGGGFHRYSTDRFWHVPHFEKMLYDNAQLATVYAEAWRLTGRPDFRQVAEELLAFVEREMTHPDGGFYSALDAETGAEEGRYYVWQREELERVLTADEFVLLELAWLAEAGPNFEGQYVIFEARPLDEVAASRPMELDELNRQLSEIARKLLEARNRRPRPLTDTKVLTGWNGLMIRGFADAGRLFERPDYLQRAARAAEFVLEHLRTSDGRLLHTHTSGQSKLNAYLDDYAYLVDGLIALHKATGEARWLTAADELMQLQLDRFHDERAGGFFFTSDDHETLLARSKDPVDSVMPSGNAVSAGNLVYLGKALGKAEYLERADQTIRAFSPWLNQSPASMPRMVLTWEALRQARE